LRGILMIMTAGFVGVLIVIRPGSGVFNTTALLALATAACFASYAVLTRKLAGLENPYTTLFYASAIYIATHQRLSERQQKLLLQEAPAE
jgi:drug/metabolite transporter (DMT)-like permease